MWAGSWGFTLTVSAAVLALIAFAFAFGTPILGVPLAILGVAVIGAVDFQRRRKQSQKLDTFREQAKTEKVDFTERDQETLVSD